ncbi:MAG: diacylglycerol kinase family lipid kinase [Anaerofustis stercorihominis]|nr:diacylglycerol kinase family lipid kinase [Anaerofustis stercorihominis]
MLYFIINPASGKNKAKKAEKVIKGELNKRQIPYTIVHTQYEQHATYLAKKLSMHTDCEAVIAVGGDGTIHEIINGMDFSVPLGIVPAGTGNDFAKAASIPTDTLSALEIILSGVTTPTDLMNVGGEYCLNVAGCGFDVEVLEGETFFRKIFHNRLGYYISLIKTLLLYHRYDITVTIDGIEYSAPSFIAAAANGIFIGGGMPVSPDSSPFDGVMDIVLIKRVPRIKLPFLLISFLRGNLLRHHKYVSTYKCTEAEIKISPESKMELDGKITNILPTKITLLPGKIKLLTGHKYETQKKEKPGSKA